MPMLDLTYPEGALSEEDRESLVDALTTVLLRAERAPDTEFFRSITWSFVHELPAGTVMSAGRPVEAPIFRVEVTTPEGALSDRRRVELVAGASKAICEIADIPEEEALQRVWVLCKEIAEGGWGAGGQVIQFQALREAAAAAREEEAAPVSSP